MSSKYASKSKIEGLFLMKEEAHVSDLYEALLGRPMECSEREGSQLISSYLTRYYKATGNDVKPTGVPYHYRLIYAV